MVGIALEAQEELLVVVHGRRACTTVERDVTGPVISIGEVVVAVADVPPGGTSPEILWIFVTSRASSSVILGKIVGILFAIIVFPQPGFPIINRLCPPAAASTMASMRLFCPLTSEKSGDP